MKRSKIENIDILSNFIFNKVSFLGMHDLCRSLSHDDEVFVLVVFWAETMFYCSFRCIVWESC